MSEPNPPAVIEDKKAVPISVEKVEVVAQPPQRLIIIEEREYIPPPREPVPLSVEIVFMLSVVMNLFSYVVSWIDYKALINRNNWNMKPLTVPQYAYYFGIQVESEGFIALNMLGFAGYIGCTFLVYWKYLWNPKELGSFMILSTCWFAFNLNYFIFRKWMLSAHTADGATQMAIVDLGTIKTAFYFYVVFTSILAPVCGLGIYRIRGWKKKIFSPEIILVVRIVGITSVTLIVCSIIIGLASKSALAGILLLTMGIVIGLCVVGYSKYMIHVYMQKKKKSPSEEDEKLIKVDESTENAYFSFLLCFIYLRLLASC